ncbi:MAG TPA: thioredoxin family protein [Dermatophilaceae bacterium]
MADDRLQEALDELGSKVEVERVLVDTLEEAEVWSFQGSPSILVDGKDAFAERKADVGLSCRLYRTPAGLARAPTVAQLIEVLADR